VALLVKNDESQQAATPATTKAGLVYTFYSFKGGVGRSMALANVAALLAEWGRKVLILDWDLEAPGIEKFFEIPSVRLSRSRHQTPGVVDLLLSQMQPTPLSWRDCLLEVDMSGQSKAAHKGKLQIISAGKLATEGKRDYVGRLREVNWDKLFGEYDLGKRIEAWRNEWIREFDFVLVDSRTGISDAGSICTILLPDVLVLVFTTSYQSVEGIRDVMQRARAARSQLPVARARLAAVPLLSRDGRKEESDTAKQWRAKIAERLGDLYKDWLPAGVTPEDVLLTLYIPQLAYWSFGERLAVIERREEAGDAASIVAAYIKLGRFLETELNWTSVVGGEVIPSEVARHVKVVVERLEVQERELEKRTRELEERQRSSSSWNGRSVVTTSLLLLLMVTAVLLSELGPPWWPFGGAVSGRLAAALFAIMGCAGIRLAETLKKISERSAAPATSLSTTATSDILYAMACGFFAGLLPGAANASLDSGLEWGLIGVAFYLVLSGRLLNLTKPQSETAR
jgi:Mrp family chromosome partitioning ATPase